MVHLPALHIRAAAGLLTATLLLGCVIPIPVPARYHYSSRQNMSQGVPEFIVQGKTTREEVLLALGQADGAALDESWLCYGCAYGKGGVVVFIYPVPAAPTFESVEYTRLVVYFDESGVVERTQFEKRTCGEVGASTEGGEIKPRPCIDVTGKDLPLVRDKRRMPE